MYELLLSSGISKDQTYFPDSGPGNKVLRAGNSDLGYFGEVTQAELFIPWEVEAAANFYAGVAADTAAVWLKFFFNKRVLYIAKTPIRTTVSWNDLYAAGLVYGDRTNGAYPAATPKVQYIQLPKTEGGKTWVLKPRLIRGLNQDPGTVANPPVAQYDNSEWTQLMGRVYTAANNPVTEKWADFTLAQLGWGNALNTVAMETVTPVTSCVVAGSGATMPTRTGTAKTTATLNVTNWRPVLELIPMKDPKDPYRFIDKTLGLVPPLIMDFVQPEAYLRMAIDVVQPLWPYAIPNIKDYTPDGAIYPMANVIATAESPTLKAFTISGAVV